MDIVERLRKTHRHQETEYDAQNIDDALNEIERLREALQDIANNPECLCGQKEMQVAACAALKEGE